MWRQNCGIGALSRRVLPGRDASVTKLAKVDGLKGSRRAADALGG